MAATRRLAPIWKDAGEVYLARPEPGATHPRHERSNRSPSAISRMPSSAVEQSVDNAQVIGSIPMASTKHMTANVPRLASWSPKPTGKVRFLGWSPQQYGRLPERPIGAHSKCDGCASSTKVRILHLPPDQSRCSSVGIRSGDESVLCSTALLRRGFTRAPCYERGGHGFDSCQRGQHENKNWRCGREAEGAVLLRQKHGQQLVFDGSNPSISARTMSFRVLNSVGRVPSLQVGCRRFDPVRTHHETCLPGAIGRRAGFRNQMFRVRLSGKAPLIAQVRNLAKRLASRASDSLSSILSLGTILAGQWRNRQTPAA